MNYEDEILKWDSVSVSIVAVKHGISFTEPVTMRMESSSLIYIVGKSGNIKTETSSYEFETNALVHLAADKRIEIFFSGGEIEFFVIEYSAELLPNIGRKLLHLFIERNPFKQCYFLKSGDPTFMLENFVKMTNIWSGKSPTAAIEMKVCFYGIINNMYSELIAGGKKLSENIVEYVCRHFENGYSDNKSIQALADSLGISRNTLHRKFKLATGTSPKNYLMNLRFENASRALLESEMPLEKIALSCGFCEKSYFSKIFKSRYGLSPGDYRKKHRLSEGKRTGSGREKKENCFKIENMDRIHRYSHNPERVVCMDYSSAEICVAIGAGDRVVGIASTEENISDCREKYRSAISKIPLIPGGINKNSDGIFDSICSLKPELVVGTSYSFNKNTGVADAEKFEERGIHVYAMSATYILNSDFGSVYGDIRNIGKILNEEKRAAKLITEMKVCEETIDNVYENRPKRVFVFDTAISDGAFTCGQSLENHIIKIAGGANVFGDRKNQYVAVSWKEVAEKNPEMILVHSCYSNEDGIGKLEFLKHIKEIENTYAIKNGNIRVIGIKKVFSNIDCVQTAKELNEYLRQISNADVT